MSANRRLKRSLEKARREQFEREQAANREAFRQVAKDATGRGAVPAILTLLTGMAYRREAR